MEGFDIHAPQGAKTRKLIVGRGMGTGKGGTSGKGNKGQKARSGGGVRLGFEGGQTPLFRRLPRRGFSNAVFRVDYAIVNLQQLETLFSAGETVDLSSLRARGAVRSSEALVKILGKGALTKKLTVSVDAVSASAKAAIEKVGGQVVLPGTEA